MGEGGGVYGVYHYRRPLSPQHGSSHRGHSRGGGTPQNQSRRVQGGNREERPLLRRSVDARQCPVSLANRLSLQGDLSENAEYDSAREEQGKLEARIKEVEYILEHATIIDDAQTEKDKVTIGSTVSLQYDGDDEVEEYRIVGSQEADPFNNKISNESPIAMAILGKKVGDMAEVDSPNGTYKVKIVKVA